MQVHISEHDEAIIRTLSIDGLYVVLLADGSLLDVRNICWGQDFDELGFHVSTNVSPPDASLPSDFFRTRDVVSISVDGTIVFKAGDNSI